MLPRYRITHWPRPLLWLMLWTGLLVRPILAHDWPRATPEAMGIDGRRLIEGLDLLERENVAWHSLLLIADGRLVMEMYRHPFNADTKHDLASCTKTVTATLLGMAKDAGSIDSESAPLVHFFPERSIAHLDDAKRAVRLEDLLTMRSGLVHLAEGLSQVQMFQSPNWVQYALDLPVAPQSTGRRFQYFSPNSHLLSAAVQQAVGKPLAEYAREQLWQPLGIDQVGWPSDPQGVTRGWGDLRLKPRDLAVLGQLYLDHGRWQGRQVVSEAWCQAMITPRLETGRLPFPSYGYQIWIAPDRYSFKGRGGQRCTVQPQRRLVFVCTAGTSDEGEVFLDRFASEYALVERASSALVEDPQATEELGRRQRRYSAEPTVSARSSLPEFARGLASTSYRFAKNPYVERLAFESVEDAELRIELELPALHQHPPLTLTVGLDGRPRLTTARYGEQAACLGQFEGNTLRIDFDELANINHWTMTLTFTGEQVEMSMTEVTDLPPLKTRGKREK